MRMIWIINIALVYGLCLPVDDKEVAPKPRIENVGDELTITMTPCQKTRPAANFLRRALGQKDALLKQGEVPVDGKKYAIYLPDPRFGYSIENSLTSGLYDGFFDSTAIGVDSDGDGELSPSENFHAHVLMRVGNRMFRVIHIAADGSEVKLQKTNALPTALVRGTRSAALELRATNGKAISMKKALGKARLFWFWSPT